jgi:hypothetical protein
MCQIPGNCADDVMSFVELELRQQCSEKGWDTWCKYMTVGWGCQHVSGSVGFGFLGDVHLVPSTSRFLGDNIPNWGAIEGILPTSVSYCGQIHCR